MLSDNSSWYDDFLGFAIREIFDAVRTPPAVVSDTMFVLWRFLGGVRVDIDAVSNTRLE